MTPHSQLDTAPSSAQTRAKFLKRSVIQKGMGEKNLVTDFRGGLNEPYVLKRGWDPDGLTETIITIWMLITVETRHLDVRRCSQINRNSNRNRRVLPSQIVYFQFSVISTSRKSRNDSVGIAMAYGLDDRGIGVRFPAGERDLFLLHSVQTGSDAHPASSAMGTWAKVAGREADHSPVSSTEVKNT
jgi:hypothetical protein